MTHIVAGLSAREARSLQHQLSTYRNSLGAVFTSTSWFCLWGRAGFRTQLLNINFSDSPARLMCPCASSWELIVEHYRNSALSQLWMRWYECVTTFEVTSINDRSRAISVYLQRTQPFLCTLPVKFSSHRSQRSRLQV